MCVAYISLACDAEYIAQAEAKEVGGGQLRTIAYEIEQTKWKFKWQLMRRALQSAKAGIEKLKPWKVAVACSMLIRSCP